MHRAHRHEHVMRRGPSLLPHLLRHLLWHLLPPTCLGRRKCEGFQHIEAKACHGADGAVPSLFETACEQCDRSQAVPSCHCNSLTSCRVCRAQGSEDGSIGSSAGFGVEPAACMQGSLTCTSHFKPWRCLWTVTDSCMLHTETSRQLTASTTAFASKDSSQARSFSTLPL